MYREADLRQLATGTDQTIKDVFADAIAEMRRERDNIATEKLRTLTAFYGRSRHPRFWQTVVIERSASQYRWASPNGIEEAVAKSPDGMDALGFLSLALPELLADLLQDSANGGT
ncbi:hypothetical protein [Glycomyces xiaoerkulensis]|uniref:hypothetical protein n=1 Tax=Glycomyces xiaoerkulensis TaxID=2038139 RepID=UPI000C2682EB|nr:hypothetical protein [Glycomyces xiaoerkulensis]